MLDKKLLDKIDKNHALAQNFTTDQFEDGWKLIESALKERIANILYLMEDSTKNLQVLAGELKGLNWVLELPMVICSDAKEKYLRAEQMIAKHQEQQNLRLEP